MPIRRTVVGGKVKIEHLPYGSKKPKPPRDKDPGIVMPPRRNPKAIPGKPTKRGM